MRILMTADGMGGVWTYALELTRALRPVGVEIVLATMGDPLTDAQRAAADAAGVAELHESDLLLEWMPDPWEDVAAAGGWLLELERYAQPVVVHLNGYAHAALPWTVPVVVVAHSDVLSWWDAVRGHEPPPEYDRYREAVARGLQAADAVVAPTAAVARDLRQHYGAGDATVIVNGRSDEGLTPAAPEPFILTSGRIWDPAKNAEAVARVAPLLSWPVVVAGEDEVPTRGVQALGRLPAYELAGWLRRAAIFALPARYEPFGFGVLEAGLAGCALVLGDIPSLREVWGDAALFVPPDDDRALADALEHLIADDAARAAYADAARQRARRFTAGRMAASYLEVYAGVIREHIAARAAQG